MRRTRRLVLSAVAVLAVMCASCGSDKAATSQTNSSGAAPASSDASDGDITVFAASSLTSAFTEIGDAFMAQHPGTKVTFNFASSSDLVTQINDGAPADVYAAADEANMKKLTDAAGTAGEPVIFATNSLQIVVEAGNPKGIASVADLADAGLIYVTCAPEVPIGQYAAQVLANAGVAAPPASLEENVKGIVTKVTLGEADAGIVYKTDVLAAGDAAKGVDIPADMNVTARYPIAVTKHAPNAKGAEMFQDFVVGEAGQTIMATYGFTAP